MIIFIFLHTAQRHISDFWSLDQIQNVVLFMGISQMMPIHCAKAVETFSSIKSFKFLDDKLNILHLTWRRPLL